MPAAREHLDLLALGHGAVGHGPPHPHRAVDIARLNATPRFQPRVKRPQHRRRLLSRALLADHRQAVAPSQDMDPDLMLDLRQIAVEFAAQVDQQSVVRKFEQRFHNVLGTGRGGQRADAQGNLLPSTGPNVDNATYRV